MLRIGTTSNIVTCNELSVI